MNKLYSIYILCSIFILQSCTKEDALPYADVNTFIKFKGDPLYDLTAVDAKLAPNGGVLLLANATDANTLEVHPKLIKVDNNGVTEWEKTLEALNHISYSLQIIDESNFIVVGEDKSTATPSISVLKVDKSGGFTQYIKTTSGVPSRAKAVSVDIQNNFIIVAGETTNTSNTILPVLFHLDFNLAELSFITLSGEKSYITNQLHSVDESGVLYAYISGKNPISLKSELIKVKLGDAVAGSPTYPQTDNSFSISGFSPAAKPYFGLIGNNGNILTFGFVNAEQPSFLETFTDLKSSTTANNINSHSSGNFIVGGTYFGDASNGFEDFILMIVDKSGTVINERIYGGKSSDLLSTTLTMPEGNILLYGHSLFGDVNTLLLIKTDDEGNL